MANQTQVGSPTKSTATNIVPAIKLTPVVSNIPPHVVGVVNFTMPALDKSVAQHPTNSAGNSRLSNPVNTDVHNLYVANSQVTNSILTPVIPNQQNCSKCYTYEYI